jgi:multiple sugar transport system ATP-binding protein
MGRISLEHVTKRFGDVVAVDDLTLDIADREFLVLLGPSGCGKSTALRMIAGLEEPTDGIVRIGDRIVNDVEPKDRDVAMVFQSYALYPHMTVRRNIEFPLRTRRMSSEERTRLVDDAARILALDDLLKRKPGQLSGGQRQRVALARAIVRRPEAFLMDEPLSNLDAKLRVATRAELVELHDRLETTVVYVTHDQVEAMTMATRIAILDQGRLQQLGPPQEVYAQPANLFVAAFIGSPPMNTIHGDVIGEPGALRMRVPGGTLALPERAIAALASTQMRDVVLGVRPEHVRFLGDGADDRSDGAGVPATVTVVESLGHERHVVLRLEDGQMIIARIPTDEPVPSVGDAVRLGAADDTLHLFDPTTANRVEW